MRRLKIIGLALFVLMAIGVMQAGSSAASKPGAAEYEFCVKRMPKKLRYKGQPAHVRTGCHARFLIFSATETWEVEGMPGWSGSYVVFTPGETLSSAATTTRCARSRVGRHESGGYGGLIVLNESTQPGTIDCVEQAETWYTKAVRS